MKPPIHIETNECIGCGVFAEVCPANCIRMVDDDEGFLVPSIDAAHCLHCRKCEQRCPVAHLESGSVPVRCVAAKAKESNKKEALSSSSAGVFYFLAKDFIQRGGVVYGAAFSNELTVQHIRIDKLDELWQVQGSKYVQSRIDGVFSQVMDDLKDGRSVLFSGTPCQVAALNKMVEHKDKSNLYTVDLICHGVPSPKLFQLYLRWLELKHNAVIENFSFRASEKPWGGLYYRKAVFWQEKTQIVPHTLDPYYIAFIQAHSYRESCYICPFANQQRQGDMSLGDYWGIEISLPEFAKEGDKVSAVLVNTEKGEILLQRLNETMMIEETSIEDIARQNKNLLHPSARGKYREKIYDYLKQDNFAAIVSLLLPAPIYAKNWLKSKVPLPLKRLLKKCRGSVDL